jgi:uncharacterized protein (TIGR02266 family)
MNAPSPAPIPPPSREAEFARAEAELASQEARVADQLNRAVTETEALTRRLAELRQQVSRASTERQGDEHVRTASTRLESAAASAGSTAEARERSLTARHEALEARRRASQETQTALKTLQHLHARAQQELAEAEAGLKRSAEAAAKAQREREAERTRQATAQARPVAQTSGNLTIPEPRPLGARSSRVRMQATIDLRSESNFFTGFTANVSEGGIFVATVQAVPRGTTVDLDFTLPGGRPMKVTGVVRWTREVNDKTPELMPGLGVRFSNLAPEVASAITDFVATREPMFFPD